MQNPNGPSIAALETCLASAALTDASAATRCWAVPRLCRCCTFATPEAERSTPLLEVSQQRLGVRGRVG